MFADFVHSPSRRGYPAVRRKSRTARRPISTRNPAVEWDRFAAAAVNIVSGQFEAGGKRFGGSTLATQIEKYRHSPEGRTSGIEDKLRQITTASVRAYQDGPDTMLARQRIVVDYVNSTPLSARAGFGEVIGLADGLWAWYGTDLNEANRLLEGPHKDRAERERAATVYKQVLSLLSRSGGPLTICCKVTTILSNSRIPTWG